MRPLTESLENYLKTILMLKQQLGAVRSVDVAEELGFSRPSVSHAVKILEQKGLLDIAADNHLELTKEGVCLAETIRDRYDRIEQVLSESLGIDSETAKVYACRMEHILSDEAVSLLKEKTAVCLLDGIETE